MNLSSDSEESDSELSEIDISEHDMKSIIELDTRIQQNPNDYDAHLSLIHILRRCGMRERLREARRAMRSRFPLTEEIWTEWIDDEIGHAEQQDDVERVVELLKSAQQDYLSVSLWIRYLE